MELRLLRYFVAVADEGHIGRAAARLNMTQPPLSRAIRALETELGVVLLERTSIGVTLTAAGTALHHEARVLLEQSERLRVRVAAACGSSVIIVGTLADTADQIGNRLVGTFRDRQPHVDVIVQEADLSDPTAGLRAGSVDVALTRTPSIDRGSQCTSCAVTPSGWSCGPTTHWQAETRCRCPSSPTDGGYAYPRARTHCGVRTGRAPTPPTDPSCGRSPSASSRFCGTGHRRSPRSISSYRPAYGWCR
ncbi:MAG: LysR family transcriptional regulator [Williamsia sp.]|nr:LysR family transcriptional regulator [Williamsia sp.]